MTGTGLYVRDVTLRRRARGLIHGRPRWHLDAWWRPNAFQHCVLNCLVPPLRDALTPHSITMDEIHYILHRRTWVVAPRWRITLALLIMERRGLVEVAYSPGAPHSMESVPVYRLATSGLYWAHTGCLV